MADRKTAVALFSISKDRSPLLTQGMTYVLQQHASDKTEDTCIVKCDNGSVMCWARSFFHEIPDIEWKHVGDTRARPSHRPSRPSPSFADCFTGQTEPSPGPGEYDPRAHRFPCVVPKLTPYGEWLGDYPQAGDRIKVTMEAEFTRQDQDGTPVVTLSKGTVEQITLRLPKDAKFGRVPTKKPLKHGDAIAWLTTVKCKFIHAFNDGNYNFVVCRYDMPGEGDPYELKNHPAGEITRPDGTPIDWEATLAQFKAA